MTTPRKSIWTREWFAGVSFRRCLRRCCSWPVIRAGTLGLAALATLVALFYAVENWRGKRAWERFQRESAAQGERLDIRDLAPAPVPDDENLAMAPIFVESLGPIWNPELREARFRDTNYVDRLRMNVHGARTGARAPSLGGWVAGEAIDHEAWQMYYRTQHIGRVITEPEFPIPSEPQAPARDVLLALSRYDDALEELHQANRRRFARFPINYEDGENALLPHAGYLNGIGRVLTLRASAALTLDETGQALEDVRLALRLIDSMRAEPLLISQLVRMAMFGIVLQPVWEGLVNRQWSGAQLAVLEDDLVDLDFLSDYGLATRGERAVLILATDRVRRTRDLDGIFDTSPKSLGDYWKAPVQRMVFRAYPSGWFRQYQVFACRLHQEWILPVVDVDRRIVSPETTRQTSNILVADAGHRAPYRYLDGLLNPSIILTSRQFARAQFTVDAVRIGFALERHRQAHGDFPDTLDALVPEFLEHVPHDVINGQPLEYRRADDGQYILYSVGWNQTDNGGIVGRTRRGFLDLREGDWVWFTGLKRDPDSCRDSHAFDN